MFHNFLGSQELYSFCCFESRYPLLFGEVLEISADDKQSSSSLFSQLGINKVVAFDHLPIPEDWQLHYFTQPGYYPAMQAISVV